MGGARPCASSVEKRASQSPCCVPSESHTQWQSWRLTALSSIVKKLLARRPDNGGEKFLALHVSRRQARGAMSTFARSINYARAPVAALVSVAFLWALALSASPQLHQLVHKDANRVEHNCAVTMMASGSYDHAANPPLISAADLAPQFSKIPALIPRWVQSPFLGACIFEHAPPFRA
jgi:hypothetical protein